MTADGNCSHEIKRCLLLGWKAMTKLNNILKSRDITLPTKVHLVKTMVFPVVMYGCESWTVKEVDALKNWSFWTVMLDSLESPLDCKEIQLLNPKGNQPWISIGRTDAEAKAPILWPPDVKSWLIGKSSWCWERPKAEGERDDRGWDGWMASPSPWTDWAILGAGDGNGCLACCSSSCHKESDTTEWLNWTEYQTLIKSVKRI